MVNTVNFSNHSGLYTSHNFGELVNSRFWYIGYRRSGGTRTTAQELNDIFRALELNELLMPARVLTGYIPGAEALQAVQNIVTQLKHSKPSIIYVLDRAFSLSRFLCH